jgi:hypothetical protein
MHSLQIILAVMFFATVARGGQPVTVGIEGRLEVVLPVAGLKARPPERHSPMAVRIAFSTPEGTSTRYELRYIGLVPGRHDLRPLLVDADGTPATGLPPIEVEIRSILPDGQKGTLIPVPKFPLPSLGGYRWFIAAIVVLWLFAAVPLFRRRSPQKLPQTPAEVLPPTLVERLRPLVEKAAAGSIATAEKAELERLVMGHWREQLQLDSISPWEALQRLKAHPQAGQLLRATEDWLHRPPGSVQVDLAPLLAAYSSTQTAKAVA